MTDAELRTRGRRGRAICRGAALLLGASLASAALAEVRLSTYVHKVQPYTDSSGAVQQQMVEADSVLPGDELHYTITFTNTGPEPVDAGSIVITNPLPDDTEYLPGSAAGDDTEITFSADGESFVATDDVMSAGGAAAGDGGSQPTIRWLYQNELDPGESSSVSFSLRLAPEQ
jgi:uncharacterized repeat protein (TIGR01451 family)